MHQPRSEKATLALADGTIIHGYAIGYRGTTAGEMCFNTSMTGYQEIFTDPSYHGQLMIMTYPHIGNYGVSSRDEEAHKVMISGLIVRSFSHHYSNPMADDNLNDYLKRHRIVGINGIDTRRLVRHIREKGDMNAVISSETDDPGVLVKKAGEWPPMAGLELAGNISRKEPQTFKPDDYINHFPRISQSGHEIIPKDSADPEVPDTRQTQPKTRYKVAALDYGIKQNIINSLLERGCMMRIFPARTDFESLMEWQPDAFFFSNGPGDPNAMDYAVETVTKAKNTGKPIFGICLGHQLLALSEGMSVIKMFVGHRGANQPVKNLKRGRVEITTQNHGFAVDPDSVTEDLVEVTHRNLNDGTLEGLNYKRFNGFGVQYHPEASPGPHDSSYLLDEFVIRIRKHKEQNGS